MSRKPEITAFDAVSEKTLTISFQGLMFSDVVRAIQDELNNSISIIYQEGLAEKIVYLDAVNQPVNVVLSKLARRFGVAAIREGDLWYFGELKPEDRATYFTRVPRLSKEELQAAAQTMISSQGRVWASPDGLLLVSDGVDILQRVHDFVRQLRQQESPTWVVQLYLVTSTERNARSLGINVDHLVRYSYNYATGSGMASDALEKLDASLDAVLVASYERAETKVEARPLLLLSDGERGRIRNGQRYPVARRSENIETGVISTIGYDYIDTGLSVDVTLRENSDNHANLVMNIRNAQVIDFVDGQVPVTVDEELRTTATIRSGGVYLLGSLDVAIDTKTKSGPGFTLAAGRNKSGALTLIWARTYRVGSLQHSKPLTQP